MKIKFGCIVTAACIAPVVAFGVDYDSTSYVQSGLVLQYDADENAGRGVHDPSATKWIDLSGNNKTGTLTKCSWDGNSLIVRGITDSASVKFDGRFNWEGGAHTVEICAKLTLGKDYGAYIGPISGSLFPMLMIRKSSGSFDPPSSCFFRMRGYGTETDLNYKNTASKFSFDHTAGQTISFSQSGTIGDGVVFYLNGKHLVTQTGFTSASAGSSATYLGLSSGNDGIYYSIRIYNRELTEAERRLNARVDQARFVTDGVVNPGTYYVDTVNGNDSNTGHEYSNPMTGARSVSPVKTLTKALSKAPAESEVVFLKGRHCVETQGVPGNNMKCVTIRGESDNPSETVVEGTGLNRFYYCVNNASSNHVIRSLTLENFGVSGGDGGAVYAGFSTAHSGLVVTNCIFRNCTCTGKAGALYLEGFDHSVIDCKFLSCKAGGNGGAIYRAQSGAGYDLLGKCLFRDCCTTNNGSAGAVFLSCAANQAGVVDVISCMFKGNHTLGHVPKSTEVNNWMSTSGAISGLVRNMTDCDFVGNYTENESEAWTNSCAGAWSTGAYTINYNTTVANCNFISNSCNGVGGAVYGSGSKTVPWTLTFTNCLFEGNFAKGVGAVFYNHYNAESIYSLNWLDCTFRGNRTANTGKSVAAVNNATINTSEIILAYVCGGKTSRCLFEDNVSYGRGSALTIYNRDANNGFFRGYTVEDCIFRENYNLRPESARVAAYGGPLYFWTEANGPAARKDYLATSNVVVRNCLFDRNVNSNYYGGAIAIGPDNALYRSEIENCTFAGNTAAPGFTIGLNESPCGGIYSGNAQNLSGLDTYVRNCIFAGNHQAGNETMVRDFNAKVTPFLTNCLFAAATTSGSGWITLADGDQGCLVGRDPKFVDAASGDYNLRKGSSAIDSGINGPWMTLPGAHDLTIMNEGGKIRPRICNKIVDIGCYEWKPTGGMIILLR